MHKLQSAVDMIDDETGYVYLKIQNTPTDDPYYIYIPFGPFKLYERVFPFHLDFEEAGEVEMWNIDEDLADNIRRIFPND